MRSKRLLPISLPIFFSALSMQVALAEDVAAQGYCGQPAILVADTQTGLASGFSPLVLSANLNRHEPAYFDLELAEPINLTILTESGEGLDPFLTVFDAEGETIAHNDDGDGDFGLESMIELEFDTGRYCVQIRPVNLDPATDLQVSLKISEVQAGSTSTPRRRLNTPEITQGETSSQRTEQNFANNVCRTTHFENLDADIASSFANRSTIGDIGENETYGYLLKVLEATVLDIRLNSAAFDTVLTVNKADGTLISENDDYEGTNSRLALRLEPGEYCANVRAFSSEAEGTFTISFTQMSAQDEINEAIMRGEILPTPESGIDIIELGALDKTLRHTSALEQTSWFSFTLEEAAFAYIRNLNQADGFRMFLYREDGERLAEATMIFSNGSTYVIAQELLPGKYFLVQTHQSSGSIANSTRQLNITRYDLRK